MKQKDQGQADVYFGWRRITDIVRHQTERT